MNELRLFESEAFGDIRTLEMDGTPWFVAADICRALDIGNPSQAVSRLDEDEKSTLISNEGRALNIVSESGLYALVLSSRKPDAKAFKRWITHDVIPAIRKTGSYSVMDSYTIDDPIERAKRWIAEQEERRQLSARVSALSVDKAIMQPKADYFDQLVDRNLLTNLRDTAKELHMKQNAFVAFLLEKKYMYRDQKGKLMPYAKHVDAGLFEVKEFTNEKTGFSSTQALITPKGRETFRLLITGS